MENVISVPGYSAKTSVARYFGLDTAIVMFFLSMDVGNGFESLGIEAFISFCTIGGFVAVPYWLPAEANKPNFTRWVAHRLFIAFIGVIAGIAFRTLDAVFLMESFKYLPMTLLIFSGIYSAAMQIRGIIGVRLAS